VADPSQCRQCKWFPIQGILNGYSIIERFPLGVEALGGGRRSDVTTDQLVSAGKGGND